MLMEIPDRTSIHFLFILYHFQKCLVDGGTFQSTRVEVETNHGKVAGRTFLSVHNQTIYSFQEIPYAQPPVGRLRFRDPIPVQNWTGVLQTTNNTKICWENRFDHLRNDPRQNEDCLYLNVYCPKPPKPINNLPVYVYIYGGKFLFGHGSLNYHDPQLFVDSGIIAVTLNFRSGPLGFLTTEDGVIPANLGLKDQYLALQWIRENIQYFGGDPSKVVLGGHSSGAISVAHHLISSRTSGLFRGAILQSGSAITPHSSTKKARIYAFEMGKLFSKNFSTANTSEELLNLLLKIPARKLSYAQFPDFKFPDSYTAFLKEDIYDVIWRPVIERADIPNAYLTKFSHNSLLTGSFEKIPAIMGIASEEIRTYDKLIPHWAASMDTNTIFLETGNLKLGFREALEEKIKQIYTNSTFQKDQVAAISYLSDYVHSIPSILTALLHSRFADTYFYQFSYFGELNGLFGTAKNRTLNIEGLGNAAHSEEIQYLICPADLYRYPESDRLTSKRLIKLWTNFVKYLNPTPTEDILLDNKKWAKCSENDFNYFDIDANITINRGYPRRLEKWMPLIDAYYQFPLDTL